MEKPIIDQDYPIQRMEGKGGWSFVEIEEIPKTARGHFGWVIVKGTIDSYELSQYKLWGMKNGNLFLPIKADIRKQIKKQAGDTVRVTLYLDESPLEIPGEFLVCLMESPHAQNFFESISTSSKKHFIDWIYEAKSVETRVNRITKAIGKMEKGLKVYQSDNEIED